MRCEKNKRCTTMHFYIEYSCMYTVHQRHIFKGKWKPIQLHWKEMIPSRNVCTHIHTHLHKLKKKKMTNSYTQKETDTDRQTVSQSVTYTHT